MSSRTCRKATYGGDGRMMLIDGGDNIRVPNNTSFNSGTAIYAYGHAVTNFVLENNIVNYGDLRDHGRQRLARKRHARHLVPERRRARQRHARQPRNRRSSLPATGIPANWAAVGFVDLAGGNYRLASHEPLHRRRHRWQHARG